MIPTITLFGTLICFSEKVEVVSGSFEVLDVCKCRASLSHFRQARKQTFMCLVFYLLRLGSIFTPLTQCLE